MIYNRLEYQVRFYEDDQGEIPLLDYLEKVNEKEITKILNYIEVLRSNNGYLDEPYAKHVRGKIRELRVDFSANRHRIFYFTFIKQTIVLLHAFLKKTEKTPVQEIEKAENNLENVINNPQRYE